MHLFVSKSYSIELISVVNQRWLCDYHLLTEQVSNRVRSLTEEISDEHLEKMIQQLLWRRQKRKREVNWQKQTSQSIPKRDNRSERSDRRPAVSTRMRSRGADSQRTMDDDELLMQDFNTLKVKDELHDISERLKVTYCTPRRCIVYF